MTNPLSIIVLAAGQSSRMKSDTSKVLHKLAGWTVLRHVLEQANALRPEKLIVVTSPDADSIQKEAKAVVPEVLLVEQAEPLGTGDAVKAAISHIPHNGCVLVLFGDSPLIQPAVLQEMVEKCRHSAIVLSAMQPHDPAQYGRIVTKAGRVEAIVEYKEANEAERAISLCNAGIMAMQAAHLPSLLDSLRNDNAKGEYYLTDCIKHARSQGLEVEYVLADEQDMLGINNRAELATAEAIIQQRLRNRALAAGVGMVAPETVFLCMDTQFGYDVLVHPYVTFGTGVSIGDYNEIRSFSHIEGAITKAHVTIGPYARIRPGTVLEAHCGIGNFVEVKNAVLHEGVKAGHLTYLGDAEIGAHTNIGAGTITCNYDGKLKHKTTIGERVFVGSDSSFIAPVTVGDDALIAAGSVITDDVPPQHLALARGRQVNKRKN